MTVYITAINFNYDEGYGHGMTGVTVRFQTDGAPYSISGEMKFTKSEYLENQELETMRALVKQKIIADLQ